MGVLVPPQAAFERSDHGTGHTSAAASQQPSGWDGLSEQERLKRLDSMDQDSLRAMVATMPVIEQAKGIVMGCYGVDPDIAFAVLRRASSSGNLKLRALAVTLVEAVSSQTSSTPGPRPSPCNQVRRVINSGSATDESAAT